MGQDIGCALSITLLLLPDFSRPTPSSRRPPHPTYLLPRAEGHNETTDGKRRRMGWVRHFRGTLFSTDLIPSMLTVLAHLKPALSPHPRRTLPALRTTYPRERRTQTAPIAVHTTRTNTTGVELALCALAPSTLHISRRNRVRVCFTVRISSRGMHRPFVAPGMRNTVIARCRSYFAISRARCVKSGAIFLQMTKAKGGMGQWDDVGPLNFHFPQ
jgi:hypothetical protein